MPRKERICGIYCIENIANHKRYIGQSVNIYARWFAHKSELRRGEHVNSHLQKAWDKYGETAFAFSILEICTEESLNETEEKYIAFYKSANRIYGYNIEESGCPEHHRKEETKEKIRRNRNTEVSAETREKISKIQKGRRLTDEWKQHISEAHKSAIARGTFAPKVENLIRYNISIQKQIECYDFNGRLLCTYKSVQEAGRQLNLPATNICKVLKNKYKSCGGYIFRYAR